MELKIWTKTVQRYHNNSIYMWLHCPAMIWHHNSVAWILFCGFQSLAFSDEQIQPVWFFLNYCWKQILAGLGTIAIWYFMSTTFPYQCWNVVFLFITALIFIYKHIYRGMWHTWFTLGYLLHLSVLWCCPRISLGAGSPNQLDDCIFCIFWFISYFTSLHNQFCSVLRLNLSQQ